MKIEEVAYATNIKEKREKQYEMLEKAVTHENNNFTVRLLWNNKFETLPDNFNMALQRLRCFERKLKEQPDVKIKVNEIITYMERKGYIRKVTKEELTVAQKKKWYLPTFIVRNPNKPEKVRLVWDAAAKYNGVSLNDCLEKGPDLLNSLIAVIFNFRTGKIGVCGDISEMFYRVKIHVEDQLSQLFLWRNKEEETPEIYAMCVLTFGASCSPALAQYVKNKNALLFEHDYPRAAKCIIERHYMDDMMDSVDTAEKAIDLAKQVRTIHKSGNFHIRNWLSNSKHVLKELSEEGDPEAFCKAGKRADQIIEPNKVLGMWWDTNTDVFTYNLKFTKDSKEILEGRKLPTKRQLLRLIMSIFDPLGILNFYLIDVKILMQNIWRCGIGWDEDIPEAYRETWSKWIKILKEVTNVKVPRHYFQQWSNKDSKIELHVIVDASESAYAAVAYFRTWFKEEIYVSLIGSKVKVAPLRPISIPRMELLAAVLGARFALNILQSHDIKITNVFYWSDSKTVLSWIRSDPLQYKQFVMFQIGEIQEITKVENWNYIPSKVNVADLAAKALLNPSIDSSSEWFTGPSFLRSSERKWPKWTMEKTEG